MKRQKIITLRSSDGEFYNFFNTSGSTESLNGYLCDGWIVLDMEIDKERQKGWVLLEKEVRE